jgi:hypothetical protein
VGIQEMAVAPITQSLATDAGHARHLIIAGHARGGEVSPNREFPTRMLGCVSDYSRFALLML